MCRPFLWEGSLCSQFRPWLSTVHCPWGFRVGSSSWEMLRLWGLTSWLHSVGLHWHPPCKTHGLSPCPHSKRCINLLPPNREQEKQNIRSCRSTASFSTDTRANVTTLPTKLSLSCVKLGEVGTYPVHLMPHTSFILPSRNTSPVMYSLV